MLDIKELLSKLTITEKAGLCSGLDDWHTKPVERLGIPSIMVADGPHGLRKERVSDSLQDYVPSYPATCFPTASALACSWDRDLLFEVGEALAEECLQEGVSVILGPGVNIKRSPLCGRNFEYFSEDPYLAGQMAVNHIRGVQSKGIGTSLKHFTANNQEFRRMAIDACIDERALREIYLAAFEMAVKEAQPWTVMCAYNRLNGTYCSENEQLLTRILRDKWGFQGLVMSDWGAVNQRVKGLQAGLDLEMPGGKYENEEKIVNAVQTGELKEEILDRGVERVLKLVDAGIRNKKDNFRYDEKSHHALARKAASECIVLLKNENAVLPLKADQKIAVIGDFAKNPRYQGYGSSVINPIQLDCAYEEMLKYCKDKSSLVYAQGFLRENSQIDEKMEQAACEAARHAQVVVLFLGLPESYETEGMERENMRLPDNQDQLLQELKKVNGNIVVILSNGSPVELPWIDEVQGIVEAYLSGQAGGGAIADILFGKTNPSGKLAETFPIKLEDNPSFHAFPGGPKTVEYRESIYVGYRYYDKANVDVRFPFGYGLSYTSFTYEMMKINKTNINAGENVEIRCTIRNSGKRAGKEIAQLYVGWKDAKGFHAVRELKGFAKVSLQAGETKELTFTLGERAFAFYDAEKGKWNTTPGEYQISIGASSRDMRLTQMVTIKGEKALQKNMEGLEQYTEFHDNRFSHAVFQRLYKKPLPSNEFEKHEKITLNTPLVDFNKKLLGKLIYSILKKELGKHAGFTENPRLNQRVKEAMVEMPLQAITNSSSGTFTEKTASALVHLANGEILRAIKIFVQK